MNGDPGARIAALNEALLAGPSATETLERWCGATLLAERVPGPDLPPDDVAAALLGTVAHRFRHVRLCVGAIVVSQAENWYVPHCLTPAMNALLDTTDAPFGRVVRPLRCRRQTLAATILPAGGPFVIEHRAVLFDGEGALVCVVRERYTRGAVAFG